MAGANRIAIDFGDSACSRTNFHDLPSRRGHWRARLNLVATKRTKKLFRIYSWNVNGLRSIGQKGFLEWLRKARADVVAVQETRATPDQLPDSLHRPPRWKTSFVSAERKGYSGVGLYSRQVPDAVDHTIGEARFDQEGRVMVAQFGALKVVNVYFPNGSGRNRDNSRVPFKLDFYRHLFDYLEPAKAAGERVLVMGDFNTAHQEIDLARPKQNHRTSGFLIEEREEMSRWLASGWLDTFRKFHKGADNYSWWSQRFGVREKNIGWRIDYILASEAVEPFMLKARIHPKVMGSDHCPISLDLSPDVLTD